MARGFVQSSCTVAVPAVTSDTRINTSRYLSTRHWQARIHAAPVGVTGDSATARMAGQLAILTGAGFKSLHHILASVLKFQRFRRT